MRQITVEPVLNTRVFSQLCIDVMDVFLKYPEVFFSPKTMALTLDRPVGGVKGAMNALKRNSYVSKEYDAGTAYYITKENIEFWVHDFRNHIKQLQEIKS